MLDQVTIRPVLPDELEKIAYLRAVGFGGDEQETLARLQHNPRYTFTHIILAEYKGQPIGTMTTFSAQMWLSGVPVSVGAVAGVTVLPEFRNKGVAAKMMEFSIVRMVAEGKSLSVLFPYSHKYYAKFGYGTIGDLHSFRINPANLTVYQEGHNVRPFEASDLRMMRVMYKGQLTWHNGWFTRSDDWWETLVARWPNIMVFDNDGFIEGFYAYDIKTGKRGERELHLIEFFAAEDAAYRGLIGYLAAQNEADVIEYLAPPNNLIRHGLRQPYADEAESRGWIFRDMCHVTPGPMGRIINLPAALKARFYTRGMSGERVIQVTDPFIPTNEDPVVFRVVDGRAEVNPAGDRAPQIETDIATLSQLVCGYMTMAEARRLNRLQADEDTCSWYDQVAREAPLYIQPGDWF